MTFLKNNILTICGLALVAIFGFAGDVFASYQTPGAANDVVGIAEDKAVSVFSAVRGIIFIVGGFGLVALAFFAIFGKLKWTWFASLAVGLAILAAAGAIIDYATTKDGASKYQGYLDDTLTK